MSYRDTANDLTAKVKLALEKREELVKQYENLRAELRVSKAENTHLLDMILKAYPDIGEDISSCSSSDEYATEDEREDVADTNRHGHRNGKRECVDSPSALQLLNSPTRMTKRRRRQGKRDDRNDPKRIEPLPRDSQGHIVYPIVIGRGQDQIEVHDLGRVIWEPETYHTSRYIWTPGFRSTSIHPSIKNNNTSCIYTSEVLEGNGEAPVFQVTAEDMPDKPFRASSSSGVWKQILDILTAKGINVKTHASGPQMYGLGNLGVTKLIQELEGAEKCSKYIKQKWIESNATNTHSTDTPVEDDDDDDDDDDDPGEEDE
ncbi:hypothetical protein H4S08_003000 [Coemansia sp. RSA 1365]|nr:hypothetical protein H4S08_003000 [Coemansia sp. RSA 1365]